MAIWRLPGNFLPVSIKERILRLIILRQSLRLTAFFFDPFMANGYPRLHPNISMHILHTVLYTFHKELTRRICLTIKSSTWSFPLFSWSWSQMNAMSVPLDFPSKKIVLLFFAHEKGLGHVLKKSFRSSKILFSTSPQAKHHFWLDHPCVKRQNWHLARISIMGDFWLIWTWR